MRAKERERECVREREIPRERSERESERGTAGIDEAEIKRDRVIWEIVEPDQ